MKFDLFYLLTFFCYMKNTKKAFTLVELIVVITILAILGTIAFISLQGYSSDARNTKRASDLGNINSKITAEAATGRPLMSFITPNLTSKLATIALGWTGAEAKADAFYNAGTPNYTSLWVKEEDFKDPTDKHYIIAATSLVGGKYDIAASIEDWAGWYEAKVEWTYFPRDDAHFIASNVKSVDPTNRLVVLEDTAAGFFRKNDTITEGTAWTTVTTIEKISKDWLTLTVWSWWLFTAASQIELFTTETLGLIDAGNTVTAVVVEDWSSDITKLPY